MLGLNQLSCLPIIHYLDLPHPHAPSSAIDCQQEMGNRLHWPVRPIQPIIPFPVVILWPNWVDGFQYGVKSKLCPKGPYIKDVRKIFGIFNPPPPFVRISRNLSVLFVRKIWQFSNPPPPSVRTSFMYGPLNDRDLKIFQNC